LLIASLVFYGWGELKLLWIMVALILVNYVCGLGIARARARLAARGEAAQRRGRRWLLLSLVADLGMLAFFKYANFGLENFNLLAAAVGLDAMVVHDFARVALPLGISFYSFQSMSYTIDVYRGQVPATRNLIDFACYVAMFPQLVAGPIVRYIDIAEELVERRVTGDDFAAGALRFCIGLAKKVLIANTVAVPADAIFGLPTGQLTFASAWLGVLCYTLQIYFDFSAYSDMAIGLGRMFGFHFIENFRYPYVSRCNQEFWRRWHISLSTWFRDYVYIPLGGNQKGPVRTYVNLVLVFFLCGLWHGASWTFVIWGLSHGVFLIMERRFLQALLQRCWRPLQHGYLLLVAMSGWVLFRSETMAQASAFFAAMVGLGTGEGSIGHMLDPDLLLAMAFGCLFSAPVAPTFAAAWQRQLQAGPSSRGAILEAISLLARPALVAALFFACAVVLSAGTHNPFIYFRF
jgi:alginate O-acetyltransferase complex protein AlgI